MSDSQIAAASAGRPSLSEPIEQMVAAFICSVGYKGLAKHTNTR